MKTSYKGSIEKFICTHCAASEDVICFDGWFVDNIVPNLKCKKCGKTKNYVDLGLDDVSAKLYEEIPF